MKPDDEDELTEKQPGPRDEGGVGHPRGALFVMLGYLMMIIAFWLYVFGVMVERGV